MIVGLQALRFIAAAFVVLNHSLGQYENTTPFGFFGVDIFFVLSGFIISYITENDSQKFFVKRLIRIVPLYWLFTIGIAFVAFLMPELLNTASWDIRHIVASLLFFPYWTDTAGFSPILLLGWTLNFEMLFYLVFFLSMKVSHANRELIASILLIAIPALLATLELAATSSLEFYTTTIWLEFIFGMVLARMWRRSAIKLTLIAGGGLATISVFVLILMSIDNNPTGIDRIIAWGVPSFVMVFSFLSIERYFSAMSSRARQIVLWLGEMSYPLYLIHIYWIAIIHRVLFPDIGFYALFALSLTCSLVVSTIVSSCYDMPIRKVLRKALLVPHNLKLNMAQIVETRDGRRRGNANKVKGAA